MESKGTRIAKTNLKKRIKWEELIYLISRLYYIATVTNTMWYQWNGKHIDQQNKIENSEIESHKCARLVFDKRAKAIKVKAG